VNDRRRVQDRCAAVAAVVIIVRISPSLPVAGGIAPTCACAPDRLRVLSLLTG